MVTLLRATLLITVLTAVLASCSSSSTRPGGQPLVFPPRPAEISIEKAGNCTVLSKEQQKQLKIFDARASMNTVNGQPSPGCTLLGREGIDFNTQTIPVGAEIAVRTPNSEVLSVNGFGAVRDIPVNSLGPTPLCQIAIDAAQGKTIRVQASATPRMELEPPELCRRATEAASMVMTTLVATASR